RGTSRTASAVSDENFFTDLVPAEKPAAQEEQAATDLYGQPIYDVKGKLVTEIKRSATATAAPETKPEPEKIEGDAGIFSDLIPEQSAATPATPGAKVRIMAYGPIVGEHHRAANFGPAGNPLQPYDVAASPNLGFKLGEWIDVKGKPYRVADWSYLRPGVPTRDTIEVRDMKDQGRAPISLVNLSPDEIQRRIKEFPAIAGEVTGQAVSEAGKAGPTDAGIFSDLVPKKTEGEKGAP